MTLTTDQRRDMYREYGKGAKVADLVRKYGVSRKYFYRHLKRYRGQPPRKVDRRTRDVIATLNFRGHSDRRIAEQLGLSQDTVSRHRVDMKLPEIPKRNRNRHNG